jgi:hypothetical protein
VTHRRTPAIAAPERGAFKPPVSYTRSLTAMPSDGSSKSTALRPRNRSKTTKASTKMTSARLEEDLRGLAEAAASLEDARPPSTSSSLRVVLGVFSQEGWVAQRAAHRSTWMRGNGLVCTRERFAFGCGILARFVVQDTPTLATLSRSSEPDLFVLSGAVSRFHALLKTVAWMRQAPIAFADLSPSHVGKMDMDTFVRPSLLLQELAHMGAGSSSTAAYYGRFMGGRRVSELCTTRINAARTRTNAICGCPPHDCLSLNGFNKDGDSIEAKVVRPEHQGRGHCWWFAQGGFYLVTPDLAKVIGRAEQALLRDERSYANSTTCEDILVGRLLFEARTRHVSPEVLTNVVYLSGSGEGCLTCRTDWRAHPHRDRQQVLREAAKRPWVHLYYSSTAATRAWLS